jgi:hypothetical protein
VRDERACNLRCGCSALMCSRHPASIGTSVTDALVAGTMLTPDNVNTLYAACALALQSATAATITSRAAMKTA